MQEMIRIDQGDDKEMKISRFVKNWGSGTHPAGDRFDEGLREMNSHGYSSVFGLSK